MTGYLLQFSEWYCSYRLEGFHNFYKFYNHIRYQKKEWKVSKGWQDPDFNQGLFESVLVANRQLWKKSFKFMNVLAASEDLMKLGILTLKFYNRLFDFKIIPILNDMRTTFSTDTFYPMKFVEDHLLLQSFSMETVYS